MLYIQLESNDTGTRLVQAVEADSIRQAIIRMNLCPFTYPDDFYRENSNSDPDKWEAWTYEEALDRVCLYYGLNGGQPSEQGNYVDGDSNSQWTILQVKDSEVSIFGCDGVPEQNKCNIER